MLDLGLDLVSFSQGMGLSAVVSGIFVSYTHRQSLKKYLYCPVYEILTRGGLEVKWNQAKKIPNLAIAFLDIDKLKEANKIYGQVECDRRLAESIKVLRKDESFCISGRCYYGDEIILLAPVSMIDKPVNRVSVALKQNGLSATIGICRYKGQDSFEEATREAVELVESLKNKNLRGIIEYRI